MKTSKIILILLITILVILVGCNTKPEPKDPLINRSGEAWVEEDPNGQWKVGVIFTAVGATGVAVGVPLTIIGVNKKKKSVREFKQNCIGEEPFDLENPHQYQLNLNVNQNGLGLTLVF